MKESVTNYKIEDVKLSLKLSISNQNNEYWGYYDSPEQWCVYIKFEENPYRDFLLEVVEFEYNKNRQLSTLILYDSSNKRLDFGLTFYQFIRYISFAIFPNQLF